MNMNTDLLPTRAKALLAGQNKVSSYEDTGGAVTAQFASYNLSLLPPIPASSIIHDNACGAGTATLAILSCNLAPGIKIHATDTDQIFLDALQDRATKESLPVEVQNQKSEALPFPDDFFTHSITNIAIFFTTSAGLDGTKEIYRTLKPGGTAVVNCWEHVTWFLPLKMVHDALRPGKPYPAPVINWGDGKQIQKVMREAGFKEEDMKIERSEAWAKTKDLRGWAEKSWAYLGGIGVWEAEDEQKWDEAVDLLQKSLLEAETTKIVDDEVWMRASQWVVVATK